jgi:hypothetical protein
MPSTFGAGTLGFGALTGWAIQSSNSSDENKRANTLNETGNESVSNLFDDTTQVTTSYKATVTTAPTVPATLGEVINGVTLTGIQLSTDAEDFATMTLTGHIHVGGTHGTVRTASHSISLRAGFGASPFGVTGNTTVRSSDCSITCEHIDVPDEDGDTAAGENYDGKIECTVRVLGSGASVPSGFDRLANATDASNTDFRYQELRFYKAISMA